MGKSIQQLIEYRIDILKKRQSKTWISEEERTANEYTIEELETILTTLQWHSHEYTSILTKEAQQHE